jgi:hypothetical protein
MKKVKKNLKRESQIKQGAYDGRYKVKVVPNKKKIFKIKHKKRYGS